MMLCLGSLPNLQAQGNSEFLPGSKEDIFSVVWVKNWPSAIENKKSRTVKARLNSILFGIRTPELKNPVAIIAANLEDFWILDQGNKTVFHTVKGVGDIPHPITKTGFDLASLVGLCSLSDGSVLFTDSRSRKIYCISESKKKLQVFSDTLQLEQPTGIAYLPEKKQIWVLETAAHRIAVLNESGNLIKRFGTRGDAPGEFNFPTHIWADGKGLIYVTDAMNFRIQVLDPEGNVVSVFGEAGDASGYMARPKGTATDSHGNIYVVDALFHVVQVFDIKGTFLYKFGNQGHGNEEFWMPSGIYIDKEDYIYVADTYNSRIQIFQLTTTHEK